jgi:hypothetical protein
MRQPAMWAWIDQDRNAFAALGGETQSVGIVRQDRNCAA